MKKTTWAIIGLSICVVVLATALGVVLFQQKTETIIVREPDFDSSSKISSELQQIIESFYISPLHYDNNDFNYLANAVLKSAQFKTGNVLYHNNQMYGVPIVSAKGLKVYHNDNGTTYVISKEK